jgi:hypothetical protein
MMPEKILYTDGHEVTVTDSFFRVKNALYQLSGVTKHGLLIIHPDRLFPFITALLGAMMIAMGAFHLIPARTLPNVEFHSIEVSANTLSLVLGIGLLIAGGVVLGRMKDRYAIRIATAEGEKNVLVSPRREYIAQVVDALNKAFQSIVKLKHEKTKWVIRGK